MTVALNYQKIEKDPQRITKIKPFINKHSWEGINFSSEKDDWKKVEKNIVTNVLNVLYAKKEKVYPAYVSKYNSNCEKQVILLMISNGKKWYYLAVKEISALLRGVTSKNNSDFYCLNCLHSFKTKNKRESHKKVCKNKHFCNVIMPSEDTKLLEFKQYQKSHKVKFIIYVDLECMIEKIYGCKNNAENSSTIKEGEHVPLGSSMSTISSFRSIQSNHDVYRGKNCMKKFCESLREHAMNNEIINKRAAGII